MEEIASTSFLDGEVLGIRFGLATRQEICTASISDCPISHASQLANPFLGLPLEFGKCESCGTSEAGKCEGHFGYIEMPIPIYHPSHVSELKKMLSLLCLKCLKIKKSKFPAKNTPGLAERLLASCCEEASQVSIKEVKKEGACYLELKLPQRTRGEDFWKFLEDMVMEMLKRIPAETRKKLSAKGYFPQDGYILPILACPAKLFVVPEISDGDPSISMLKKVLRQVEIIKSSRSGTPNFQFMIEANDLQVAVNHLGTAKASRDIDTRFGLARSPMILNKKHGLENKTLFIRKVQASLLALCYW
ncbi:dna-directed rna polymerase v subunit 1 [Quercus suber]|uniref:DNA-directed RNA polymerase n=1 Tax=Quercus suber TaxID=58331 RepID=A0AAW0KR66_QUESU